MENNKLKVKDLVNIGIFSALYMAIAMVVMLPVESHPFFGCFGQESQVCSAEHFLLFCWQKCLKWDLLSFLQLSAVSCFLRQENAHG